jgi:uncharacterized protein (TIGR03435 family)
LLLAAMSLMTFAMYSPAAIAQTTVSASDPTVKKDLAGDWQGTLIAGGNPLRLVMKVTKSDKGYTAKFLSIDQGGQAIPVNTVTVDGVNVKLGIEMIGGSYTGVLATDGDSITGNWAQGPTPLPLTLVRATKETAWEIPAPPAASKPMDPNADPSFDVATIKPNDKGATNMQGLTVNGRNFTTRATSLVDLISFAYNVQKKQIVNGPDWLDHDRFDIDARIDTEGSPNTVQTRMMIRKLLAERFGLKFHNEKRDLSAFVLTQAKGGSKMTVSESKGTLPGFGMRPVPGGLSVPVFNASMSDFLNFLQAIVVDRPVVDQTGLTGRYDFIVKFAPDDSMFNGHAPVAQNKTDAAVEAQPSLFEAFQQQLGLKLDAQKTAVDVIAVDHVEKPSAN